MLKNSLLIKALLREKTERTPVWLMRQAGRYLPEYREVRAQAGNFMNLCKTPELACKVTMQPLERFNLDAAILFSDILTIPDAMGLDLHFVQNEGPVFNKPIKSLSDINNLAIPDPHQELRYVVDAVSLIKKELNNKIPLIGFSGSPWTLATYMVEGSGSKTFSKAKGLAYSDPESMHLLLDKLAKSIEIYLIAQIEAGADVCMIFDTWGGILTPEGYLSFSLHYMSNIVKNIKLYNQKNNINIPIVLFTKNGGLWIDDIADSGCDGVGIDWTMNIKHAREIAGDRVAIQGNLDPAMLYAKPEQIRKQVAKIIDDYGNHPGHIFNLGHGIYPDVDPEHVTVMIEAVKEFSGKS